MSEPRAASGAGVAAVISAATIFSWGFVIVKFLGLPPAPLAFWRLLIGAAFLLAVARLRKIPFPEDLRPVIGAGLFFGAHQLLYIFATLKTSIAIVTLLGALMPLVVSVISRRTVGEPVPPALRWWALVAVAGVGVVVHANLGDQSRSLLGDLVAVANLLAFTAFFLFSKRAREDGAPTVTLTASTLLVAMVVVGPALLFVSPVLPEAGWQWGLVALLALGPGNGHLLLNWAHRRVSAALASLTLAAVPLLASLWAHLVFAEPYTWRHVLGMLLVAAAVEGGRRAETQRLRQAA